MKWKDLSSADAKLANGFAKSHEREQLLSEDGMPMFLFWLARIRWRKLAERVNLLNRCLMAEEEADLE